jgi:hypothetical protein
LASLAAAVDPGGGALETGAAAGCGDGGGESAAMACESAPTHKETNKTFMYCMVRICHK